MSKHKNQYFDVKTPGQVYKCKINTWPKLEDCLYQINLNLDRQVKSSPKPSIQIMAFHHKHKQMATCKCIISEIVTMFLNLKSEQVLTCADCRETSRSENKQTGSNQELWLCSRLI